ncbi:hypothetical protein [Bacteroides sp. 519]|uniref:hypothetical protein n=1 Tax=Bacteroides sp. 519 TaxID=2302937 RepID=UPI0013D308A0|nr:hypothetical protein [Bacteroides sp. 519]NDV59049.1 hypothetical protein [Bacteroides sp. 519]
MELIDLNFYPNIGLGNISFYFQENDILQVMGSPEKRMIYSYSEKESAICLFYNKLGISFWIHYEDNLFNHLSISIEDIILDGMKFSLLSKQGILEFVRNYHYQCGYDYLYENTYNENVNEEFYYFENIGLSIWFEEDYISDISIKMSSNFIMGHMN